MAKHTTTPAAAALAAAIAVSTPAAAPAQEQRPAPREAHATAATAPPAAASLVSLERIRRQLRETPPPAEAARRTSLLKLEYYVQVVGSPPPIDFFKDFNIGPSSAVQYGGMTHSEFLRITGPFWRKTW